MSKIPLVDDLHIRELVRVFLCNEGFEVIEAVDRMEALSRLDSVKVDLASMQFRDPVRFWLIVL